MKIRSRRRQIMATEKITFKLPLGFNPQTHLKALEALITERHGDGFDIDFIDPEAGVATASRHVAITSVSHTTERSSLREVRLPKETKMADGEKVAAKMADEYPDYAMIKFDPHLKRATLALMDATTRRARDAVSVALGVKPWDVGITPRPDGGYDLELPRTYVPSKHDGKLDEVAVAVVGREGWYVEANAQTLRASIIPANPPTFTPTVDYPFRGGNGKLVLDDNAWARVPLGITLAKVGDESGHELLVDFSTTPHGLFSGTTGSGKGFALMALLSGALSNGFEVAIADGVKGGVDYVDFQPYVRTSGWGDDLNSACCVIAMVYEEGVRRKHLIKSNNVQKWTQLPAKESVRPILLVVDELTSLISPEAMPKGVSKDNPLVTEIALRNLIKATILNNIGKIARELRFAGISLVCATQVASTVTGIPTELRTNLGAKMLLGVGPTDNNRRLALNDPDAVPDVPKNIKTSSDGASKGVAVFEFEGQESGVSKTYYATPTQYAKWLDSLGVEKTKFPRPSSAEIASYTPSLDDDDNGGGEFDLRKLPPTVDSATGEELHGFAKANEQRRLLNGTSESAAAKRSNSDDF
jgi:hypothetical protein